MIKVGNVEIQQNHFPDNTLLMKLNPNIDGINHGEGHIKITWLYESDAELFTLICTKKHIDQHFNGISTILCMPYIPHARMDRVKASDDVFTLKYFCEIINSLNFKEVRTRDAHSNVSLALLNRVYQEPVDAYIMNVFHKLDDCSNLLLFFPDEGAMKRYAGQFNMPYAFGIKKRDWATGKILGLDLVNGDLVKNRDILIIDDICSRGGTFYHSAKALKEAGAANINLYITHCENTILEGEIFTSGLINNVYTTNSLIHNNELKEKLIYV